MNVLVVEDNIDIGDAVSAHVAADGHNVDWCVNLTEATRKLGTEKYDLVLLDLRLPDGSGLSLLRDIRGEGETVPVIIMTAQDQYSDRLAGLRGGATDFLVKPFDLNELSSRMRLFKH
ncbi:response regulator [Rhizobium grahamii]|uniref:Response regulator n=1 Tax=Rhizobium grahamii TaxID=1120045 RepID=A0A370KGY1_9HYPH|nr:response regulator [Rhizobium grahamii]RDJ04209.1 response regulator [Rhizobium grahamii]